MDTSPTTPETQEISTPIPTSVVPPITPPQPKKTISNFIFILAATSLLAIFGIIFIIATQTTTLINLLQQQKIAAALPFIVKPSPTPTATPTPSTIPLPLSTPIPTASPSAQLNTSNWKTYTNSVYNYQISFPPTWQAWVFATGSGFQNATPDSLVVDIGEGGSARPYPNGILTIQRFQFKPSYPSSWTKEEVFINGFPADRYFTHDGLDGPSTTVLFTNGNSYIEILFRSSQEDVAMRTFNQIISTFKFTNLELLPSPEASPSAQI